MDYQYNEEREREGGARTHCMQRVRSVECIDYVLYYVRWSLAGRGRVCAANVILLVFNYARRLQEMVTLIASAVLLLATCISLTINFSCLHLIHRAGFHNHNVPNKISA